MDLGLTGRRALVLGSTAGLGLAVATALAHEGARVVLCGRRGDRARELAAGLPGAVGLAVDLTHAGSTGWSPRPRPRSGRSTSSCSTPVDRRQGAPPT